MPSLEVQVVGLKELQKKLDGKFLVQPEMVGVLDTVTRRAQRPTKGLGYKMNPLSVSRPAPLSRAIVTPLAHRRSSPKPRPAVRRKGTPRPHWMYWAIVNPRVKGTKWLKKMVGTQGFGVGILGSTARSAIQAAAKKIAQRWAA